KRFTTIFALSFSLLALVLASSRAEIDIRRDAIVEAVEKVKPSVVNINTLERVTVQDEFETPFGKFYGPSHEQDNPSLGSGVIVDEDGYILTNNHVIQRATQIQVAIGTNYYAADLIPTSPTIETDLIRIRKKVKDEKFHAIKFPRDDDVLLG